MTDQTTFTDDDLRAYLDNAAPKAVTEQIETALAQDPAFEDRLMALDPLAPVLKDAIDLLPELDAPEEMITVTDTAEPVASVGQGWLRVAAGFAAGLVLAGAIYSATRPAEPDWTLAVAQYQALYSTETIAPLSFGEEALRAQASFAEARIGAEGLYDLTAGLDDLELLRVQTLELDGAPVIQMVFATEDGLPVALCVMAGADGVIDSAVTRREGLESLSFDSTDHRWLLIGTQDAGLIEGAAEVLQARLNG